jgi:NTE family protein
MRVGLVLGDGGVLGGAWLTGGLHALARETDWDPGSAEYIVGTSAGSMVGALVAAGVPPWFMVAHSRGESFAGLNGPDGRPASEANRSAGAVFRLHKGFPGVGPGSLRLAITALSNPLRHTPLQLLAGWLPAGLVSTDSLKELIGRAVPGRWVDHPNYWTVACDYESGRRVAFGRTGSPSAEIADAVAASCAIPGFYRPVRIGRRRYVDGGVCSPSNVDLLAGHGLDLVICLNPLSTGTEFAAAVGRASWLGAWDPRDWPAKVARGANARRLAHEVKKVRRFGTDVVVVEPTPEDHDAMGRNLMRSSRRDEVIETAQRTVREQLRRPEVKELLRGLPKGEPHKIAKPPGRPATWPALGEGWAGPADETPPTDSRRVA